MSIIFLGSGEFAVPALEALARSEHCPRLVVTRPDRAGGRGLRPIPTPVKERALRLGLPVEAPPSANEPAFLERLRALEPDLIIVLDYGEILREEILAASRIGAFNLHASLLPRHRGAAPVTAALLAGDRETGVTLFRITKGLDSGPVTDRIASPIEPLETAGELEGRLAKLAADLLSRNLPVLLSGNFREEPQAGELATMAPKIRKGAGAVDWSLRPGALVNFVRALSPQPGAFTFLHRRSGGRTGEPERVKILRAKLAEGGSPASPGEVCAVEKHGFRVAAGGGPIEVLEIQPAGKEPMSASQFLRGHRLAAGDRFGPAAPPPGGPDRDLWAGAEGGG